MSKFHYPASQVVIPLSGTTTWQALPAYFLLHILMYAIIQTMDPVRDRGRYASLIGIHPA
ncbi:MAG: hypothetical protein AUJ32_01030 [Parcubacteria group bacterium CG1_02_40_82]|uniref:Uncharacterized protein n=4 Tax=Candidatus Portnoyibacteriota TaxID=1817913 RepID=A0A2M7IH60_9BACT|nr:MAG: hypothetical protein AUJ32_01030 [Parcubacteria group bacterium CG1_02_40_82]PIQ75378.1 MAG: hypothetical protein COV84_01590 [Candidatus Portnoybacteria bacterium CG11_big_fil_rev_8_21_14_0_20_40_15]PIS31513.1 MAG: hypothetical protein COT41_01550 [Candidatus Portnoybacteria bacterium CG08_land_8_20_14_0_20_40_83]PIW75835.1 MAG: hypothetical protein CO001_04545 [Candidatus Portnoybacteria bacterium CG_4_8_14_3_um_filter_40_10]PIY74865.1 MAG: hypothetical protein COY85_02020 [Candidatus